jgi:hypothetical protein
VASKHSEDPEAVFRDALSVIHAALVDRYQLSEREARGAEEDLLVWFRRLSRRPGIGETPMRVLRASLLSAACQYARSFQLWKLGGAASDDRNLSKLLSLSPDQVAVDLEGTLGEKKP